MATAVTKSLGQDLVLVCYGNTLKDVILGVAQGWLSRANRQIASRSFSSEFCELAGFIVRKARTLARADFIRRNLYQFVGARLTVKTATSLPVGGRPFFSVNSSIASSR